MSLRRTIRNTIKRGNTVHGIVESYANGLATVKLSEGGSRLSNLSTIGGTINVGDEVIVDYSAGITPICRPIFIYEEDPVDLGLSIAELVEHPDGPTIIDEELDPIVPNPTQWIDVGFALTGWDIAYNYPDAYDYVQHMPYKTWQPLVFAENVPEYLLISPIYDTEDAFNMFWPGPDYMDIKRAGKYLIKAQYIWDNYAVGCVNCQRNCAFGIMVTRNGTPIAKTTTRDNESQLNYFINIECWTIDDLVADDRLQVLLYQEWMDPYSNGLEFYDCNVCGFWGLSGVYWGVVHDHDQMMFTATLIPGTQG